MEIRLTVHVPRRRPRPVEVVVDASPGATVQRLRSALADHLDLAVPVLAVGATVVPDDAPVGLPPLLDGAAVAVLGARPPNGPGPPGGPEGGGAGGAGARPPAVLEIACVGGPDAGRSLPLHPPGLDVGRSPATGLRLDDPSLSRRHARLHVDAGGVTVTDLGSTNGVLVDGQPVTSPRRVDTASTLVIGASTLRLRRVAGPGMPVAHPGDGTVVLTPARREAGDDPVVRVRAPAAPDEPHRARVPWVAALVPVPVFAVLAVFLGPHLLAFALLGPVILLATALSDRVGSRRRHRQALADHAAAVTVARGQLAQALAEEARRRTVRHPDLHELLRRAEHRLAGLWSTPGDLTVRLGTGDVPARTCWEDRGDSTPGTVRGVPVVVDLAQVHVLGVVGPPTLTAPVLAGVVGQLLVRCPPSDLTLRTAPWPDRDGDWLGRVPHVRGSGRVLVVVPDHLAGRAGQAVAAAGPDAVVVVAATERSDLPDGCGAVLETAGGGRWVLGDGRGSPGATDLVGDGAGPGWTDRLSRALAPLREGGTARAGLPRSLRLGEVAPVPLTPAGIGAGWAVDAGPVAVVGRAAGGPLALDLRTDGPHVLVGGTTGSGKSEFLRTLVTALAVGSSPQDLTLLLVDFKGGAAFGPCAALPHVVGLVTDLDEHLVDRVLRSLEAELRRRERLLAASGASDLEDHRGRAGAEPLPRLVVVVDELRALVDELPDFVPGLVRLAAQGRSLGIHLVLATQRPSGTLSPEIQANVNLRIAFRVRDRADSIGVIEDEAAALVPADVPGRGLARGGDGALTTFQVALVAPDRSGPEVTVRSAAPSRVDGADPHDGTGRARDRAAETAAVVDVVRAAASTTGRPPPQRPWLPPLPDLVDASAVGPGAFALVDEPDEQRRSSLEWTPATALWRVMGRPRSGRSTALAALVHAAASTHEAGRLHVHAVTAGPPPWGALPHVGTIAAVTDRDAVTALVGHLEAVAGAPPAPGIPAVLLVVDGWEQLVELDDPREPVPLSERLLRVLRDGAGRDLCAAVGGGRDLLRASWSALGGRTLVLGTPDPLDAALLGLPAVALSASAPPGRGLTPEDRHEVQVLMPAPRDWADIEAGSPSGSTHPWRYRPLPATIRRADLPRPTDATATPGLLLGVAGATAAAWCWSPVQHGRRLLVSGPPRSGRTTALTVLAESAASLGRPTVHLRRQPRSAEDAPGGPVTWLGPDDVDRLVAVRRAHPDLVLLVDDADLLGEAPVMPLVHEIASLVDRDGGALVVATSTSALLGRFRGLDIDVAQHRTGLLLHPGRHDGEVLGAPRVAAGVQPAPPGRGVLVVAGTATAIQVLAPAGTSAALPAVGAGRVHDTTSHPGPAR